MGESDWKGRWSCGHTAGGHCAECHRLLILKANAMVALIDRTIDEAPDNEWRDVLGSGLAKILRGENL